LIGRDVDSETTRRLVGAGLVVIGICAAWSATREVRRYVYDREHDVYRRWNTIEDRIYKEFLVESRLRAKPLSKLAVETQRQYWRWREQRRSR
jgi:hypothetical protein